MTPMPPASPEDVVSAAERLTLHSARLLLGGSRFQVVMQATHDDEPEQSRVVAAQLLLNLSSEELIDVILAGAGIAAHLLRRMEER